MDSQKELNRIVFEVASCQKCILFKTALNSVPGEGNADLKIMFIGEAPGAKEDELGRPFVGRSGKLLDNLLGTINLTRDDVFITSLLKHRPPKNRCPKPEEILACKPWLDQQIEAIRPELVITLGRVALNKFIIGKIITEIHGKIQKVKFKDIEINLMPMFHPAAGLRNPHILVKMKEDFLKIPKKIISIACFSLCSK